MQQSNYNNFLFLRIDKLLAPRVFTKGDLLEMCDKAFCAVFMYNPLTFGRPWTLVKPYYPDTHTKYRNQSYTPDGREKNFTTSYDPNSGLPISYETGEGSVTFPREIYCPGPYCESSSSIWDRLDKSDTLMTDYPQTCPTTDVDGWAHDNTNNY